MKKLGFTLAEVLLTLGIVGVVAALTLPSLNSNVQNKSLEAQIQKMYSVVNEAAQRYMVDEELDSLSNSTPSLDLIEKYMKVNTKCTNQKECFADHYEYLNGNTATITDIISNNHGASYILKDGASIHFNGSDKIVFDVNGKKGPNVINRDTWVLGLGYDGTVRDLSSIANSFPTPAEIASHFSSCKNGGDYGCFAHFVKNGFKFDY